MQSVLPTLTNTIYVNSNDTCVGIISLTSTYVSDFYSGFYIHSPFQFFNSCTKKFVVDYNELVGVHMLVQKRSSSSEKKKITSYSGSDLGVRKTLNIIKFSHRTLFPRGTAAHRWLWPPFP